jgi:PhzF family phenazine biosynthesis protein
MRVPIFQLDAFTTQRFAGNPAAVMLLDIYPADAVLQAIAAENNLPETAFLVRQTDGYRLRWFTPTVEVPLCGHATLASAAVVMERLQPALDQVVFESKSGPLPVKKENGRYTLDFPARPTAPVAAPAGLAQILGAATPLEVFADAFNYTVVLKDAQTVRQLTPDLAAIARLDRTGLIVTARGEPPYDFVSRYFAPAKGIPEDPVTGGAHCSLAPFWAARLEKHGQQLAAFQASSRGGEIFCRAVGSRVHLQGACVFYMEGAVEI